MDHEIEQVVEQLEVGDVAFLETKDLASLRTFAEERGHEYDVDPVAGLKGAIRIERTN